MSKFLQAVSALPKGVQAMFNAPTEAPEFKSLKEGDHICKLTQLQMVNSRENRDGTPKANQPEYVDSFPQIFFRAAALNGDGSVVGRINLAAFTKYNDLSDVQKESGDYQNINGYACHVNKQGNLVRISSKKGMEGVRSINNSIAHALGQTGQEIAVALDSAMESNTPVGLKLTIDVYDDKEHINVAQWFPATAQIELEDAAVAVADVLGD